MLEFDHWELLAVAVLLEGCSWYDCNDTLKHNYVPQKQSTRWQDATTLEVHFGAPLRPPDDVDPRRFALLRYNVEITSSYYHCSFEVCYRELAEIEAIPESLSWDADEPDVVRLHFTEPVAAGSCEPWSGNRADYQALELIYLGVGDGYGYGTESGDDIAEPDQLATIYDEPIVEFGPEDGLRWLEDCFVDGSCEFEQFCEGRGGFSEERWRTDMWVPCP